MVPRHGHGAAASNAAVSFARGRAYDAVATRHSEDLQWPRAQLGRQINGIGFEQGRLAHLVRRAEALLPETSRDPGRRVGVGDGVGRRNYQRRVRTKNEAQIEGFGPRSIFSSRREIYRVHEDLQAKESSRGPVFRFA